MERKKDEIVRKEQERVRKVWISYGRVRIDGV